MVLFWSLLLTAAIVDGASFASPNSTSVRFFGRHRGNRFDWVGTGVEVSLTFDGAGNGTVAADLDAGGEVRFAVYVDDIYVRTFLTGKEDGRRTYALYDGRRGAGDATLRLVKATENMFQKQPVVFYGGLAGGAAAFAPLPPAQKRLRLDVYGDSDSCAYGVDGRRRALACETENGAAFENYADGWVAAVAESLDADARVQAVSGIGVVKNAGEIFGRALACYSDLTLPQLANRSVMADAVGDYDASSWTPDVVVVFLGGNDFANLPPPTEREFQAAYAAFVASLLAPHVAAPPGVVHVCNESPACGPVAATAKERGETYYHAGGGPRYGCDGHRNATQQLALARSLAPLIKGALP